MKKNFLLVGLILASFGAYSFQNTHTAILGTEVREGVSVVINVTSSNGPVAGALVKITNNGMTIGAGTTDATGKSSISIASYNRQFVQIEVSHALYKNEKLIDVILETGKAYALTMKSKSESAEVITEKSEEKVVKIEEKTQNANEKAEESKQNAEKYQENKTAAEKSQEQLKKEQEETQRLADEKRKNAEALQAEADRKKAEAQKQQQT